jgi:hypothetical protein
VVEEGGSTSDGGLIVSGLVSGVAGVAFVTVGSLLAVRPTTERAERAAREFASFWVLLGAALFATSIERILAGVGALTPAISTTSLYLVILLLCAALWGLVAFLVYVYTGRDASFPLGLFYAGYYVFLLYGVTAAMPVGFTTAAGTVTPTYAGQFSVPFTIVLVVLLFVPELAATVAYLSLLPRARDPTVRYRISMASASLLLLFVVGSFLPAVGAFTGVTHTVVVGVIDALAGAVVLLAYFPPHSIRERLGLRRFDEEAVSASA